MYQLTALSVRGTLESLAIFTVSLDGVALDHEKAKEAVPCVHDFVRQPLFTQKNLFSETGIRMLNTAVAAADTAQHSSDFDPWRAFGVEPGPVTADLE